MYVFYNILMSYKENIDTLLNEFFPEPTFTIRPMPPGEFRFRIATGETNCLIFQFFDDYIKIDKIDKCGIRGSETLDKIEQIGIQMDNIEYICLEDDSNIEILPDIEIDLGVFKILTKGESWYNSLGYVSDNYTNETQHNETIIEMTLSEFQEKIEQLNIDELQKKHTIEYYENQIKEYKSQLPNQINEYMKGTIQKKISDTESIIDNIDDYLKGQIDNFLKSYETNLSNLLPLFPDIFSDESIDTITVKQFYNKIMEIFKRDESDEEKGEWLSKSLEFVRKSNILTYNRDELRKYIRGDRARGTMKQKQRKKTKPVKKRQKKTKRAVKKRQKKTKRTVKKRQKKTKRTVKKRQKKTKRTVKKRQKKTKRTVKKRRNRTKVI